MAGRLKLILVSIAAAISIYLISLVEDKHVQMLLGCMLLVACLVTLLLQRKRE
jgi:uncharacterized membrane protein YgaE (UPF0421/DUF939 family)